MKRLVLFIVVILALLALVCVPLLHLDSYRAQIADSLTQKLGHRVVIGKLEPVFFPPALRLRDVSVMNPAGDAPLLHADEITAPVSWPALFHGSFAPDSINLRGWTAVFDRHRDGTWAWDEWFGPAAHLSEKAGWPVKVISFDRGECRAMDAYGPGPQEFVIQVLQGAWERDRQYMSVNGVFTSLPAPVSFLFQGNGRFLTQPEWKGVLGLSDETRQMKLDCKVAPSHIQADGTSDQWRFDTMYTFLRYYGRLPIAPPVAAPDAVLQGWTSHFNWQGSSLTFTQGAMIAGGRGEAKGNVQFSTGFPVAHVDVALQSAKIQPLETALFGNSPLDGTGTGLVHFDLTLSSASWSTLSGQGALEVKNGKYILPNSSTQGLAKAHTMKYLLKKFPGFLGGGLPYTKAFVRWQVRHGIFSFDNAFCDLGDLKVAAVGSYDAAHHGLDAYARVQVHERDASLLKELPSTYISQGTIQPMHGHIQGSLGEWKLRSVRSGKIPSATVNKLSKAIKSK